MKIETRTFNMTDPVTKEMINVERAIVRLKTDNVSGYLSFGTVGWTETPEGDKRITFENLDRHETETFPKGMEAILLNCGLNFPFVPVKFNHPDIGNFSEIWFRTEDLELVSGELGTKIS